MATDDLFDEQERSKQIGERPSEPVFAKLWDRANQALENEEKRQALGIESIDIQPVGDTDTQPKPTSLKTNPSTRDKPLEARLRAAARDLGELDTSGVFDSFPLSPQNEFPTSLTRLPIFRPSQRRKQQSIQDLDNAVSFDTPYGAGRRLGPPLTIRDEDTLIALMRLRDRALTGPVNHLPANVRDIYQPKNGRTEIHRVVCTINQINDELGLSDSGTNFKNTFASIKRLNASKIELDKIMVDGSRVGGAFDLIEVQWRVYDNHGLVDVIFPPIMAHWLRHSYTYIDWSVRKNLSALGKAVHRYLSGQPLQFKIGVEKLATTIGFDGRKEHLRGKISTACDELVELQWLESYEIKGNGRSKPLILHITRQR